VINKHTIKKTRFGIMGLWYDGLYLFDGSVAKNFTSPKYGDSFFDAITHKLCFSEWDGQRYRFHYNSGASYVNAVLICDFSEYPNIKFYNDTFYPNAYEYHIPTGIRYMACRDGYQYKEGGSETITTSVQTKDLIGQNIFKRKNLQYLYYDINTNGTDVSVSFYVDGTVVQTITLNHSTRARVRKELAQLEGYRHSIKITCLDSDGVKIYEPWGIEYTPTGD